MHRKCEQNRSTSKTLHKMFSGINSVIIDDHSQIVVGVASKEGEEVCNELLCSSLFFYIKCSVSCSHLYAIKT